ncbi:SDR family NAD(P)-dependent oxidoreductase [Nocardia pseudovaccinii]|uniref:SDR family NAD(P)-dependent oxidoreductase n=1 Tax=Nocardia pseudovaccinii TaxID=189540 RepID=UPI0007A46EC3|nr:SDR family NAD(P)-dependent oxidoreductase [Nocardia pseudovaccinii]
MKIEGAHAVVTGASRGLGTALARALQDAGATVALVARESPELHEVAHQLAATAYPTDLTNPAQVRGLLDRIEAVRAVDILVNNAGTDMIGPFDELTADQLAFILALNVSAPAELQRQAVPRMLARGAGHVVNIASYAGVVAAPHLATYAATRAFTIHHTANLAFEYAHTPIGFTKVELGEIHDTGLFDNAQKDPLYAEMVTRAGRFRIARILTKDEIAAKVVSAIINNRSSVRLPRRMSPFGVLPDIPRILSGKAAAQLRRRAQPSDHGTYRARC